MLEWMIMPLKRYADFQGRSRRKEYWSFVLFTLLVYIVLSVPIIGHLMIAGVTSIEASSTTGPSELPDGLFAGLGILPIVSIGLLALFALAIFIPSIAVLVRRLHDRDLSGWWYLGAILAGMIPFVGFLASIALLVVMCLEGTRGPNRFGADPKDPTGADVFA